MLNDTADAYDAETHILSCVKKAGNIDLINYHESMLADNRPVIPLQAHSLSLEYSILSW